MLRLLTFAVLALALIVRLLLFLMTVQQIVDRFVVKFVVAELTFDFFFDASSRPDSLLDVFDEVGRCAVEEELKLIRVADSSRSAVSVRSLKFTMCAVMKDEAVELDSHDEDEDGLVDIADPLFVIFEVRSDVRSDADANSLNVVVDALREESIEREQVRNVEPEVVHRVGELLLDVLFGDFYVVHRLVLDEFTYTI